MVQIEVQSSRCAVRYCFWEILLAVAPLRLTKNERKILANKTLLPVRWTLRRLLIATTILVLATLQTYGQDEKPPLDIPVYPGGSTTMEVNMTAEELMNLITAIMPSIAEKFGPLGMAISPEELADVVRDVRRIQYVQVDVPKSSITLDQIADFYSKKLPRGEWSRVIWMRDEASAATLYAQPNTRQIYGFRVSSTKQDDTIVRQAQVFKLEGKVDYVKAVKLFAKVGVELMLRP